MSRMKPSSAFVGLIIAILLISTAAYAAYPPHVSPGGNVPGPNPNENPHAIITAAQEFCIVDEPCAFYAVKSYDDDGYIEYYKWDMEDGTVIDGHVEGIVHTYEVGGWYRIFLMVRDDDGATDITSQYIFVEPIPNQGDNGGGGGNNQTNAAPNCYFTSPANGAKFNISETINAQYSGNDDYYISSYKLEVDGITRKTGSNLGTSFSNSYSTAFSNPGNYTYRLTCTDNKGLTDIDSIIVEVIDDGGGGGNQTNEAPVAVIDAPSNGATIGLSQTVTISYHGSDDKEVDSYKLYVDNVQKDSGSNVNAKSFTDTYNHKFTQTGSHTIKLEVWDDEGLKGIDTVTITITDDSPKIPPTAVIDYPTSATKINKSQTVTISYHGSDDSEVDSYKLYINTFEKESKSNVNAKSFTDTYSYTFISAGTYTIKLDVWDDDGLKGTDTVTITVEEPKQVISCTDTDNGLDYLKSGSVTANSVKYKDRCHVNDEQLYEYYCTANKYDSEPHNKLISCSQEARSLGYDDGFCAVNRCYYEGTADSSTASAESSGFWAWLKGLF